MIIIDTERKYVMQEFLTHYDENLMVTLPSFFDHVVYPKTMQLIRLKFLLQVDDLKYRNRGRNFKQTFYQSSLGM